MIEEITRYLHNNKAVIALSGKSGCGNTTVSGLIADTFDIRFVNYTFRSLAKERGISLEEVMIQASQSEEIDRFIDSRQLELTEGSSSVLASRLAIWLKKNAILKIYLYTDLSVRVQRISEREGWTEEKTFAHTTKRDQEDHDRYLKLYNIDNDDYHFADLVLNSGIHSPERLLELIIVELQKRCR